MARTRADIIQEMQREEESCFMFFDWLCVYLPKSFCMKASNDRMINSPPSQNDLLSLVVGAENESTESKCSWCNKSLKHKHNCRS